MKKIIFIIFIFCLLLSCTNQKVKDLASQTYETDANNQENKDKRIKEITSEIKKLQDETLINLQNSKANNTPVAKTT